MRTDDEVYDSIIKKLSLAAEDLSDQTVATLDGLESFVLKQIINQRNYLREERLGLADAIDRRDRDLDSLRTRLLQYSKDK